MTNFNYKLGTAVAVATFIATVLAPASLADTTVNNTGNGAHSKNIVNVTNGGNTTVLQGNFTGVFTNVNATSNTGGNKSKSNTGGNSGIKTGNATTNVNVTVGGSSNEATLPPCGCASSNTTVNNKHNGAHSNNTVNVTNNNNTVVGQGNFTLVGTNVDANSNTGNNTSKDNTGKGSKGINTGNANTNVNVTVGGSTNTLQ